MSPSLVLSLVLLAAPPAPPPPSGPAPESLARPRELRIDREVSAARELSLNSGENRLLVLSDEIGRVAVADPSVADLKVVTPTQLLLTAKGVGNTDLTLWNRTDDPLVIALRVTNNAEDLRKQLKELFPGQDLRVSSSGDLLVLSGEVSDVRIPERAVEVARLHSKQVANLVQVTGNQQVQLEVRFAEVSRSGLRELGVNLFHKATDAQRVAGMAAPGTAPGNFLNTGSSPNSVPGSGASTASGQPPDVYAPLFNNAYALFFSQAFGGFPFSVMLNLLEANGLAKVLAEPTLVTLTGQEAKFLAGGELPIPVTSALGQVNVIFKEFGILLVFTPTVIAADTIHLKLATEVSEVDPNLSVTVAGSTIPGFVSRQGETTVRLGDGQSFAIAGLLSDKTRSQIEKVPLLGSIPILGALFRSTAYRREETELLIVVTARLAEPLEPQQVPALPTAWLTHPSDFDLLLMGAQTGPAPGPEQLDTAPAPRSDCGTPAGALGFVR